MGWTFCSPDKVSLIHEIKHRLTSPTAWDDGSYVNPTDISVVGGTLYALLRRPSGLRVILVYLLKGSGTRDRWAWGYKDMSEDMGPCVTTCPLKLLMLSNCQESYAVEWRKSCHQWHSEKLAHSRKLRALVDGLYQFHTNLPSVSDRERQWFDEYGSCFLLEGGKWYTPFKGTRIRATKSWGLRYNATLIPLPVSE